MNTNNYECLGLEHVLQAKRQILKTSFCIGDRAEGKLKLGQLLCINFLSRVSGSFQLRKYIRCRQQHVLPQPYSQLIR
jgi:hypothetical protein